MTSENQVRRALESVIVPELCRAVVELTRTERPTARGEVSYA